MGLFVYIVGGVAALIIIRTFIIPLLNKQHNLGMSKEEIEQREEKLKDYRADFEVQNSEMLKKELKSCLEENKDLREKILMLNQEIKLKSRELKNIKTKMRTQEWNDREIQELFVDDASRLVKKDGKREG